MRPLPSRELNDLVWKLRSSDLKEEKEQEKNMFNSGNAFGPMFKPVMGKTYCYGQIFYPFGNLTKSDGGMKNIMQMMMMSQMFGGNGNSSLNGFNPMGKDNPFSDMFEGAFDFGSTDETAKED